jgi:hypothetical protein
MRIGTPPKELGAGTEQVLDRSRHATRHTRKHGAAQWRPGLGRGVSRLGGKETARWRLGEGDQIVLPNCGNVLRPARKAINDEQENSLERGINGRNICREMGCHVAAHTIRRLFGQIMLVESSANQLQCQDKCRQHQQRPG